MAKTKYKKDLKKSKEYSVEIMSSIRKTLDDNKITYVENKSGTEYTINSTDVTSKDDLMSLLLKGTGIPEISFIILIDVVEVDDKIFIRQSSK